MSVWYIGVEKQYEFSDPDYDDSCLETVKGVIKVEGGLDKLAAQALVKALLKDRQLQTADPRIQWQQRIPEFKEYVDFSFQVDGFVFTEQEVEGKYLYNRTQEI